MNDRAFTWGIIQFFIGVVCFAIYSREIFKKGEYKSPLNWVFFICGLWTAISGLERINQNI